MEHTLKNTLNAIFYISNIYICVGSPEVVFTVVTNLFLVLLQLVSTDRRVPFRDCTLRAASLLCLTKVDKDHEASN